MTQLPSTNQIWFKVFRPNNSVSIITNMKNEAKGSCKDLGAMYLKHFRVWIFFYISFIRLHVSFHLFYVFVSNTKSILH